MVVPASPPTLPPTTPPEDVSSLIGIAYAVIIFLCAIFPGGLPLFAQERFQSRTMDKCLILGTIFGGGVFIAAGFVHLLGDASSDLNVDDGYPLAELWCAIGVLTPLCIDSVASLLAARADQAQQRAERRRTATKQPEEGAAEPLSTSVRAVQFSAALQMVLIDSTSPVAVLEDAAPAGAVAADGHVHGHVHGHEHRGERAYQVHDHQVHDHQVHDHQVHDHQVHDHQVHDHQVHDHQVHDGCCEHGHEEHGHGHQEHSHAAHDHGHDSSTCDDPTHGHRQECDDPTHDHSHGGGRPPHGHAHGHAHGSHEEGHAHVPRIVRHRSVTVSIVGTLVLFFALTLHSFLAGLVLGLGGGLEVGLFFAIIAHKSFAAWALGCALARTDRAQLSFRAAVLSVVGFSLTTPSGVLIGMGLASADALQGDVQPTLVALASGFFLYVGLMEVVSKEFVGYRTTGSGVFAALKLAMLILGFALMALLALWV